MAVPLRIAQVVGKMNGGGVEAVVMNYYRHIDHTRVQFDFLVDEDSTYVPHEEIKALGGKVISIPPYQHIAVYQKTLRQVFVENNYLIVHSHMNTLSVLPLKAAASVGIPVRIAHSHSTWGKGETVRNFFKATLRTQANRYPTHRMACGAYAGEWLFGKHMSFDILPNAVDAIQFEYSTDKRMQIRNELGIGEDIFVVGHLGRFVTQKNHSKLIDIFNEVKKEIPNAMLLLAGDGPLLPKIREQVHSCGLNSSVSFLGQRSDADYLYSAFDCMCLPSLYEGLPVVAVEAQFCALPLVLSDTISKEASITGRCTIVSLNDMASTWADAIISYSGTGRLCTALDKNRLAVYDINQQAPRLLDYYECAYREC